MPLTLTFKEEEAYEWVTTVRLHGVQFGGEASYYDCPADEFLDFAFALNQFPLEGIVDWVSSSGLIKMQCEPLGSLGNLRFTVYFEDEMEDRSFVSHRMSVSYAQVQRFASQLEKAGKSLTGIAEL